MKPIATLTLYALSIAAALSACTQQQAPVQKELAPAAPPVAAAPASAPKVVNLSISGHAWQAPDSVDAGWTTWRFENKGDDLHYAHVVRLDPGKTVTDLVEAYAHAIRTSGPRPTWITRFGGPGAAPPGGTASVTQLLVPGNYAWICPVEDASGNPHFKEGEFKTFTVSATNTATATATPAADAVIRLMDYAYVLDAPLKAGRQTLRFVNQGKEAHDINLLKLAPGKTLDEVRLWLNPERARRTDKGTDPEASLESLVMPMGGVAAIAPGMEAFQEVDLAAGEYVLACMVTAQDGRSHIEHGMIRQISVR